MIQRNRLRQEFACICISRFFSTDMLATTLMRQQLRCMQNMVIKKPLLAANGSLVAKQQLDQQVKPSPKKSKS